MTPPAYTPATDVLGRTAPITHRATYPLLGIPITIGSNSAAVIDAAERSFGAWRVLSAREITDGPPLTLNLFVHATEDDECRDKRQPFVQRLARPYFLTASGGSIATAQLEAGEAVGFVTPTLLADELHFRYNMLECLALALVTQRDRYPIHAAAVVRDDRALLLIGRSTVGKSTLSYACLRAGWQLLAEDVVYVSLNSNRPVIWGSPWRIHLLPDAPRLFPELTSITPQIQANGKRKLAVDVTSLGANRLRTHVHSAHVCLLARGTEKDSLCEAIDSSEVIAALTQDLEAGFDLSRRADAVAAALASECAWRITVGSDLDGSVAELEKILLL